MYPYSYAEVERQAEAAAAKIETAEMKKVRIHLREAAATCSVPLSGKKISLRVARGKKKKLRRGFRGENGEWLRVRDKFFCCRKRTEKA